MAHKQTVEIDFANWSDMARSDPAEFERMRLAAIDALIDSAPEANRHRLRCLQWRIDQERRLSRSPLGACIRISRMMWDAVHGADGLQARVDELRALFEHPERRSAARPAPIAEVVVLRSHARD